MYDINTKILTVYYGPKTLQELELNTLVHSWNPETKLPEVTKVLEKVNSTVSEYYEVEFDSGLKVLVSDYTPFVAFRGYPILVNQLKLDQSVRAFCMSLHPGDGHLRVHGWVNGKAKHQYVARMVWEYYNGKIEGDSILHQDFNKLNNSLENLELLTNSQHSTIHWHFRGYKKNHKVKLITHRKKILEICSPVLDANNTFIIPDKNPVSGDYSGIVAYGWKNET